ncbi:MAG: DinB family protein [Sciscionella sp.]
MTDITEITAAERAVLAARTADERPTLEAFLDFYRDAVIRKVRGVSEQDARRSLVPSATTLGGIAKHLRWVELNWFERHLAQTSAAELPPVPWNDDDPDADFRMVEGETVAGLIADYERACVRSREVAAAHELTDAVPHPEIGQVSLRWIYVHMIEETARHAGHADILREQIDGSVGD